MGVISLGELCIYDFEVCICGINGINDSLEGHGSFFGAGFVAQQVPDWG